MTEFCSHVGKYACRTNGVNVRPFFSVIVPAYNVEEYLNECVESVCANPLMDFEIILVNDGSSDGTPHLVDEWAKRDTRIKVVHQENGGLSAARNAGLDVARGRYVVFLDADDRLAPWALADLSEIIRTASDPDVIITEMLNVQDVSQRPSRDEVICVELSYLNKEDAFRYVFTEKPHTWSAPQYLMKRSFIEKAGLAFRCGILHEDICWTAEVIASAESFAAYSHPWYIRRYGRAGSIMNSVDARHITDTVQAVRCALESQSFSRLTENQAELLRNRLALSLFPSLRQYGRLGAEAKAKVAACVEENLELFELSRKPPHRLFVLLCKTLGTKRALQIVSAR